MNEVQQLRDQLQELGFTVLHDYNETHSSNSVLSVEAWVRNSPYALIPIPMRDEDEDDYSFGRRVNIANESIEELFAAEAREAALLAGGFVEESHVEPEPEEYVGEEPTVVEIPDYSPDGTDYYAYVAPTPPTSDPVEVALAAQAEEKTDQPVTNEYAEAHRAKLIAIRANLQQSIDEIDAHLALDSGI
jgi:hypothetical protein